MATFDSIMEMFQYILKHPCCTDVVVKLGVSYVALYSETIANLLLIFVTRIHQ